LQHIWKMQFSSLLFNETGSFSPSCSPRGHRFSPLPGFPLFQVLLGTVLPKERLYPFFFSFLCSSAPPPRPSATFLVPHFLTVSPRKKGTPFFPSFKPLRREATSFSSLTCFVGTSFSLLFPSWGRIFWKAPPFLLVALQGGSFFLFEENLSGFRLLWSVRTHPF